jgi:serine/threonine protein kinase
VTADHPGAGQAPRTPAADPFATRAPTTLPAVAAPVAAATADPLALDAGDRVDDFEILSPLGRGSFGAVYLARQVSLDRQIAIKISTCTGGEGRALARLDHPNIVTVYSQQSRDGLRLLCMQYVPSLALDDLLRLLAPQGASWTGADLLAALDRAVTATAGFDPAQLSDRTTMAELDHVGAACFIGSRLAAALGHAHRHGVLHRDIKAGNVLVSCYGRPLLVDFNMAASVGPDPGDGEMFGGTLPYMAPEHLAAFDPTDRTAAAAVDQASDQYSLGVLVWQLVLGRLPFPPPDTRLSFPEMLRSMVAERRRPEAIWADPIWREEPQLAAVVRRALEPEPAARWPSCDAFTAALRDTIDIRRALAAARRANPLPAWCLNHPFVTLGIAGVLPNLLGSAVNIPYNLLRVVPEEHEAFRLLTVLLIALGMAGFQVARSAMARARDALEPFIQPPA